MIVDIEEFLGFCMKQQKKINVNYRNCSIFVQIERTIFLYENTYLKSG